MTLVLRTLEKDHNKTLAEFVLCHDRDESEALLSVFEMCEVDCADVVSDPHFYLQIDKRPQPNGTVRVGSGRVSSKTAESVMQAIAQTRLHSQSNNVTMALVKLETIN